MIYMRPSALYYCISFIFSLSNRKKCLRCYRSTLDSKGYWRLGLHSRSRYLVFTTLLEIKLLSDINILCDDW